MPLSLPDLQEHPAYYIGPNVVGIMIQALEMGFILNQFFTFWSRSDRGYTVIRCIVIFVTLVAILQTSLAFYNLWRAHVIHFGDWVAATSFIWIDKLSPIMTVSMAAPVQAFLIWRCWTLTRKSWITLVPLSMILLASAISSIIVTVETFEVNFVALVEDIDKLPKIKPDVTFILALTSSAVLDVIVTSILLIYLSRAKANVYSSRFRRVMRKLVIMVWEAAVPPCVCAILAVVTYLTLVNKNYWDLMFQAILGKLYVISLFVTLNGRAALAMENADTTPQPLTSLGWGFSRPLTLNMPTRDLESRGGNYTGHSSADNTSVVIDQENKDKPGSLQVS
ncbi:hypothetical protein QCA50_020802 [Cerrena zonata]|uniref:DUF6534 domain-containing protein n=1 Tax=Cerrena zonata TaxID=2478898 RepID=A0AAW0F7P3_9APHY